MPRYFVTIPVKFGFDREPTAAQLAAMLERLTHVLVDDYGPPVGIEGTERFDGYDGPFITHVGLGEY